jgi:hypothetical protein
MNISRMFSCFKGARAKFYHVMSFATFEAVDITTTECCLLWHRNFWAPDLSRSLTRVAYTNIVARCAQGKTSIWVHSIEQTWAILGTPSCAPFSPWEDLGIAMGYRFNGRASIPRMSTFFSYPGRPDRLWHQPSFLSNGYQIDFMGKSECEAEHSIKKTRIYTSTPP